MFKKLMGLLIIVLLISGCADFHITEKEDSYTAGNVIHSIMINDGKAEAVLCLDKSIVLRIKNLEAVVEVNITDGDINELKDRFSLFELEGGIIPVVYKDHTASRDFMIFDLFIYNDNCISRIYTSKGISAKIQSINENKGAVEISIPEYNTVFPVGLTSDELDAWKEKKSQLESGNIKIDSDYYTDIQDNILLSPVDYYIWNNVQNGDKKLYILSDVYTVGAKTPSIRDRAIIEYKLSKENVSFENIMFERETTDGNNPFSYFGN